MHWLGMLSHTDATSLQATKLYVHTYLRYALIDVHTLSAALPLISRIFKHLMVDMYWVIISAVLAPGCKSLFSNLKFNTFKSEYDEMYKCFY